MKKNKLYSYDINKDMKPIESKKKRFLILFIVSLSLCVFSFFIKSLITGPPRENLIPTYSSLVTTFDTMIESNSFENKDVYKEELSKNLKTEDFENISKIKVYLNPNLKDHNKKNMKLMYSYENKSKKNTWETFISSKLRTSDGAEIYSHIICEELKYELYKLPINIIYIISLVAATISLIMYLYISIRFYKLGR